MGRRKGGKGKGGMGICLGRRKEGRGEGDDGDLFGEGGGKKRERAAKVWRTEQRSRRKKSVRTKILALG